MKITKDMVDKAMLYASEPAFYAQWKHNTDVADHLNSQLAAKRRETAHDIVGVAGMLVCLAGLAGLVSGFELLGSAMAVAGFYAGWAAWRAS